MLPKSSTRNIVNGADVKTEDVGDFLFMNSEFIQRPDADNVNTPKFSSHSALSAGVPDIVGMSSDHEMIRVNAAWVIANMHYLFAGWVSLMDLIRKSMSVNDLLSLLVPYLRVSGLAVCAVHCPASIASLRMFPKLLLRSKSGRLGHIHKHVTSDMVNRSRRFCYE